MKLLKPADPNRSALMSRVRQKGTAAELVVAAALRRAGARYRLNVRSLPGSPDFANKKRRWAIFVHGCFWHQHPGCIRATLPKTNSAFWREKFEANTARDARAVKKLADAGFRVATVWECETEKASSVDRRVSEIFEPRRVDVP